MCFSVSTCCYLSLENGTQMLCKKGPSLAVLRLGLVHQLQGQPVTTKPRSDAVATSLRPLARLCTIPMPTMLLPCIQLRHLQHNMLPAIPLM